MLFGNDVFQKIFSISWLNIMWVGRASIHNGYKTKFSSDHLNEVAMNHLYMRSYPFGERETHCVRQKMLDARECSLLTWLLNLLVLLMAQTHVIWQSCHSTYYILQHTTSRASPIHDQTDSFSHHCCCCPIKCSCEANLFCVHGRISDARE